MGVIWWRETDRNVGLDYLPWWFSRCLYVRVYLENRKSLSSAYQIWENSINRNRSPKVLHNVVKATMDNSCSTTLLHFLSKETYSMKIGCGSNKKKEKWQSSYSLQCHSRCLSWRIRKYDLWRVTKVWCVRKPNISKNISSMKIDYLFLLLLFSGPFDSLSKIMKVRTCRRYQFQGRTIKSSLLFSRWDMMVLRNRNRSLEFTSFLPCLFHSVNSASRLINPVGLSQYSWEFLEEI